MRYAENWTKVEIKHLNLEKILIWCGNNLKGKQFVEGTYIKFDDKKEADMFKSQYTE